MTLQKNQFGVPQYPDSDARHLFVLLGAIDLLERPTIATVSDLTGLGKEQITLGLQVLQQQYGVDIQRLGEVYRIESWGDVLNRKGVVRHLKNGL